MRVMHKETYDASLSLTIIVCLDTTTGGVTVVVDVFEFGSQERFLPDKRLWAVENVAEESCVRVSQLAFVLRKQLRGSESLITNIRHGGREGPAKGVSV